MERVYLKPLFGKEENKKEEKRREKSREEENTLGKKNAALISEKLSKVRVRLSFTNIKSVDH